MEGVMLRRPHLPPVAEGADRRGRCLARRVVPFDHVRASRPDVHEGSEPEATMAPCSQVALPEVRSGSKRHRVVAGRNVATTPRGGGTGQAELRCDEWLPRCCCGTRRTALPTSCVR